MTLGVAWRRRRPSQFEEEMVAVVDQLAAGPFPGKMLMARVGIEATEVNLSRLHGRGATWTGGVEFVSWRCDGVQDGLDAGLVRRALARDFRGVDHEALAVDIEDPDSVQLPRNHSVLPRPTEAARTNKW